MSMSPRGRARQQLVRRAGWVTAALVILALILLLSGHWILGIVFGAAAAVAVLAFLQLRTVR
jgi:ATP/ADP translocase